MTFRLHISARRAGMRGREAAGIAPNGAVNVKEGEARSHSYEGEDCVLDRRVLH